MKRIRLRLLLTIYNLLLVISPIFAVGTSGIYQHSVALTGYISPETGKAPTAYLWIPEGCQQVKAVMLAQQNMTEEMLYKNEMFRERMEVLDVALVWVAPWFSQNWDPTTGCQVIFEEMMVGLAGQSGHRELEYCPVIPFGHSAQATFPWNFAAWNNDRTLCIISFHGDAPRTNLCGYGTANAEWGRTRNIDGIPGLMTFWYFDKEMAELAEARYAETRGKQTREIGEIKTEWSKDGQTLTVTAPKDVRVEVICGPLRKSELRQPMINDQLSMINYEKYPYECGLDNPKHSFTAWLVAILDGDATYKRAVKPFEVMIPH